MTDTPAPVTCGLTLASAVKITTAAVCAVRCPQCDAIEQQETRPGLQVQLQQMVLVLQGRCKVGKA